MIFTEFWKYLRTATIFDQSYTPTFIFYDGLLPAPLIQEENQARKATQQPTQLTVHPSQLSMQSQLFPLLSPLCISQISRVWYIPWVMIEDMQLKKERKQGSFTLKGWPGETSLHGAD